MKSYFVDTNIFIYAQGCEHKYRESCQLLMRLIASDEIYGATNTEVLQEILYRYNYLSKRPLGIQMVENILAVIHEVLPVERADVVFAANLMKKYHTFNVRDAIHAASAIRNNFKYILSVDRHFDRIKGLQRISPMDI